MVPPLIKIDLSWPGGKGTIVNERSRMREKINLKVLQLQKQNPHFAGHVSFKKLSKSTNKFLTSELKDLVDGDCVHVVFKNAFIQKSNPVPNAAQESTAAKVKFINEKIKNNDHLSDNDRKYIYNFISEMCEYCFGQFRPDDINENSKKRRLDDIDNRENINSGPKSSALPEREEEAVLKQISPRKNVVDVAIQADLPIFTDYITLNIKLKEMYKRRKQWDPAQRSVFENTFRNTFAFRRNYIVSDDPPKAAAIKEMFPYLFQKNMVFMEFELITNKENMLKQFQEKVELYSHGVLQYAPECGLKKKIQKYMLNPDDTEWVRMTGSLLLLPKYMEVERKGIILYDNEELLPNHHDRPYIKCSGDNVSCLKRKGRFSIYADNIELCITSNLIQAYFALLATYYIFNAVYPESSFSTFACLERLYIEHTDDDSYNIDEAAEEKIKLLKRCGSKRKI